MIQSRWRQTNALRSMLREFYPGVPAAADVAQPAADVAQRWR